MIGYRFCSRWCDHQGRATPARFFCFCSIQPLFSFFSLLKLSKDFALEYSIGGAN